MHLNPAARPRGPCPPTPRRRGGGVAHGPVVRSHAHDLPKRVRRLGLQCALSAKAWERRLLVVDSLQPAEGKTVGGGAGVAARKRHAADSRGLHQRCCQWLTHGWQPSIARARPWEC